MCRINDEIGFNVWIVELTSVDAAFFIRKNQNLI